MRAVVLAGSGRGFCSGHDLKEIQDAGERTSHRGALRQCSRMMMSIAGIPQPVIARVHGAATAAGCQLVAACDLAVASREARFATPGSTSAHSVRPLRRPRPQCRPQACPGDAAHGETIDAARAERIGLVNRVVAPEGLEAETDALAHRIASRSPSAIASGKEDVLPPARARTAEAYALASGVIAHDFVGEDGREGVAAFLEKRAPAWRGR